MEHRTHSLEDFPTWDFSLESRNHKEKSQFSDVWDLETINTPTRLDFTVLYLCTSKIFIYIIYIYNIYYIIYYILLYYTMGGTRKRKGFEIKSCSFMCSVFLCIVQFTFLFSFLLNKFCFFLFPLCSIRILWILIGFKSNYYILEKNLLFFFSFWMN